jgi:hypothetical protein
VIGYPGISFFIFNDRIMAWGKPAFIFFQNDQGGGRQEQGG